MSNAAVPSKSSVCPTDGLILRLATAFVVPLPSTAVALSRALSELPASAKATVAAARTPLAAS